MNIELRYFTGTGNSLRIIDTCREIFQQNGHDVRMSEITKEENRLNSSDLLGFCFPVYAFGIPRISRRYLKSLKKFADSQKVFILITAGDSDESGYSINECEKFLVNKNCEIIYTSVVQMPINWTTSPVPPYPPTAEEAKEIIKSGVAKTAAIANEILAGVRKFHKFNYPKRYNKAGFYKDYLLFKYMGLQNYWRTFRVYDSCNGCKLCSRICPTDSIRIVEKKPVWSSSCEQCMRCVNFCPEQSIYQTMGGDTKGKNRYFEPGFKPVKRSV